jgi:FkbM family methyltransferase
MEAAAARYLGLERSKTDREGNNMTLLNSFQEKSRSWLQRVLPPSRAYISWRFDQVFARLDQIEGHFMETRLLPGLQEEILAVLRLLEPKKADQYPKIRVGTDGDGGYVQIDDLEGISRAFSFGVADNDDWDVAMAKVGVPVEQFDHSVTRSPSDHPLLHFHRKMISTKATSETATISDLVAEHSKLAAPDLILKMDIENGEWDVFDNTGEAVLAKFAQIVCEFHNLSQLTDSNFRPRARRVFEKLGRHFSPIHVHGNNCCGIVNICNITVPDHLEISYASKARYSFIESNETFPTPLDAPNCPQFPSIVLGTFRF